MEPLVQETLLKQEVYNLLKLSREPKRSTTKYEFVTIYEGWFKSWTGELHGGYIIAEFIEDLYSHNSITEYYFMETSETLVSKSLKYGEKYEIEYHRLLPINTRSDIKHIIESGDIRNQISKLIVENAIDNWGINKSKDGNPIVVSKLEFNTNRPLSDKDRAQMRHELEQERSGIRNIFKKNQLPPPEDDIWYKVLADVDSRGFGDRSFELEIMDILKENGHSVRIGGEKDSFGWVTRGLVVDGKYMCCI